MLSTTHLDAGVGGRFGAAHVLGGCGGLHRGGGQQGGAGLYPQGACLWRHWGGPLRAPGEQDLPGQLLQPVCSPDYASLHFSAANWAHQPWQIFAGWAEHYEDMMRKQGCEPPCLARPIPGCYAVMLVSPQ